MVKLGIIGLGNMGTKHLANITSGKVSGMEVTAICDIDADVRKAFEEKYPHIKMFESAEDLYKSGLCDSVIVATYHYDHPKLVMQAFDAGLDVITEKPAGVYTKQVQEMNEAAEKSGRLFGIMYNQRTNPLYQKIKKFVESGELGEIKRIQWTITSWYRPQAYHDSSPWRSNWKTEGGGALINQNPHQLDLWQWMFGMPDRIYAKATYGKHYDIEVEDEVTAFLEYDNGVSGVYITSTGEFPGTNRLEIACSRGKLVCEDDNLTFVRNEIDEREFNRTNKVPFGRIDTWNCEIPKPENGGEQHVGIFKDWVKAKETGAPLLAPGVEGINGLTISNAMHLSSWTGKEIDVKNFPHDEFYTLLQEKIKNSKPKKSKEKIKSDLEGTY